MYGSESKFTDKGLILKESDPQPICNLCQESFKFSYRDDKWLASEAIPTVINDTKVVLHEECFNLWKEKENSFSFHTTK